MFRLPWKHVTDDELVERIRQNIESWDRASPWMRAFSVALNFGLVIAFFVFARLALAAGPNAGLGLLIGLLTGLLLGSAIHQGLWNLILSFTKFRTERLLIKYHDMLAAQNQERADGA